jgi:hypothetical protein
MLRVSSWLFGAVGIAGAAALAASIATLASTGGGGGDLDGAPLIAIWQPVAVAIVATLGAALACLGLGVRAGR